MTQTLTTELQQFEEWFVEKYKQPERLMKSSDGKYKFSGVQMAFDAWHDSRELLANREAQPVAWRHDNGPFAGMALTRSKSVADSWTANGWTVTPLYTAPPAPAVPEEITPDSPIIIGILPDSNWTRREKCIAADMWNACRAAMLAQHVSQGCKLPPHAYRELVNVLRDTAVKYSGTDQLRERLNTALSQFIKPDHPHTRTAAPEGGNDSCA